MCEIAIINPGDKSVNRLAKIAMAVFRGMNSSLGMLFLYENDARDEFRFETYQDTDPQADEVKEFIGKNADGAIRLFIHGRLATFGEETDRNAHPLEIECPECDIDYLMHNGVLRRHRETRENQKEAGHEYNTGVDSEEIAHAFGKVPEGFDHGLGEGYGNEPAFVLFNKTRVYIFNGGWYDLTGDARMSKARGYGPSRGEESYNEVIMTPTNHAK